MGDDRVTITYCTQCRWLLRAAWYAQELLTTFHRELREVALRPATGGVFTVEVGDRVIWDRSVDGGFPEITVLKRAVRDLVAPDKPLGHSDVAHASAYPPDDEAGALVASEARDGNGRHAQEPAGS